MALNSRLKPQQKSKQAAAHGALACAALLSLMFPSPARAQSAPGIPSIQGKALDGHDVAFPRDLAPRATVFIVGFTRKSSDFTTPWEKAVRAQVASADLGFYDVAVLQDVPGFVHGLVMHSLRSHVPDVVKPHLLTLWDHEPEWKTAVQFDPKLPDASYVVLVDHTGAIVWRTRESCTPAELNRLLAAIPAPH